MTGRKVSCTLRIFLEGAKHLRIFHILHNVQLFTLYTLSYTLEIQVRICSMACGFKIFKKDKTWKDMENTLKGKQGSSTKTIESKPKTELCNHFVKVHDRHICYLCCFDDWH